MARTPGSGKGRDTGKDGRVRTCRTKRSRECKSSHPRRGESSCSLSNKVLGGGAGWWRGDVEMGVVEWQVDVEIGKAGRCGGMAWESEWQGVEVAV